MRAGKTKKLKKVSLFKKTTLDEGNFTRSSGRGKRKSGREKKLDRETVEESQPVWLRRWTRLMIKYFSMEELKIAYKIEAAISKIPLCVWLFILE